MRLPEFLERHLGKIENGWSFPPVGSNPLIQVVQCCGRISGTTAFATMGLSEVELRLRTLHPYELPAIHAVALDRVYAPYAAWIVERSSDGPAP